MSAHQEIETLLEKIGDLANNGLIDGMLDRISDICSRFMADPDRKEIIPGVHFAPNEHAIVELLAGRMGQSIPKWALLENTKFRKGGSGERSTKNVDVYVCRVRRKLKGTDYAIETDWGQGYRLVCSKPKDMKAA